MINLKYMFLWLRDLWREDKLFKSFFVTENAWGSFYKSSHIRQDNGEPKIRYGHLETAKKAAEKLTIKTGKAYSYYRCIYCGGFHIGKCKYLNKD